MLQASHRCLLVCIVESCLVLLREEALSLLIAIEVETQDQTLITPHVCEMTDFERAEMANFYLEKTNDSIKIKNSLLCFDNFDTPFSQILVSFFWLAGAVV